MANAVGLRNTSVKKIDLTKNGITDEGAVMVAQLAEKCAAIEELCLGNNDISDLGCIRLAEMVERSSTLCTLELFGNHRITDEGAMRMAVAVERNSHLVVLNLSECHISEMCAERFMQSLMVNSSLHELWLHRSTGGMSEMSWKRVFALSRVDRVAITSSGIVLPPPRTDSPTEKSDADPSKPHLDAEDLHSQVQLLSSKCQELFAEVEEGKSMIQHQWEVIKEHGKMIRELQLEREERKFK
eukprot:TRINITY_DN72_c0_g1_i3.p1 TRINITY_DN72_c0_g1~~TRINITY_DN72_c0_g1_i3.p1  ORF type:complete len:242 (+),score=66.38 TRINITY_DN72_c0_g1_i3:561-1286(+)